VGSPAFQGFPAKSSFTPLPNPFFSELVPQIDSLGEMKLVLHIFWKLYRKRGKLKFVTLAELLGDRALVEGFGEADSPAEAIKSAIESAVNRGVLLRVALDKGEKPEELYFVNNEANRAVIGDIQKGRLSVGRLSHPEPYVSEEKPNIFALYEENIGLLTPMISEELKEAEKDYPSEWIEDAFREAVSLNRRSWRYIARILERWASEGRDSGKAGGHPKKKRDPERYVRGKYGHLVER